MGRVGLGLGAWGCGLSRVRGRIYIAIIGQGCVV